VLASQGEGNNSAVTDFLPHIRTIDSKLALLRHFNYVNYAIEQRDRTSNPNLGGCPSHH
jgi:hypothetical protein